MIAPHATYFCAAIVFMVAALCFIAVDSRCKSSRAGWMILTLFTGIIGLGAYLYTGRR